MRKLYPLNASFENKQRGVTLIELLVGITIGLMAVGVAAGALLVSRGISGTVTDASQIQQQASFIFRIFGQQLRQAGSMRLDLAASKGVLEPIDPADLVAFSLTDDSIKPVNGKDAPALGQYKLSVGYQNYEELNFVKPPLVSFFRDCLGSTPKPPEPPVEQNFINSSFVLKDDELKCLGGEGEQPLARNIADFQVNYFRQTDNNIGSPKIQIVNAATIEADPDKSRWKKVYAIEVCVVLYGDERIDMPAGSSYTDCKGAKVNMSSTGALPFNRKNRLHLAFRTTYQLRSQGLTG